MSARQTFWGSPEKWPNDSASYIFLARAVDALGKSMYGKEWAGDEATVQKLTLSSIDLLDDVYLNNFLATYDPNSQRKQIGPVGSRSFQLIHPNGQVEEGYTPEQPVSIEVEERIAALSLVEKLNSQREPAIERFAQVQNEFAKLAESEKLLTAYRDISGGDQVAIPRVWWNTERLQCRFSNCQIEPSAPFNKRESGSAWIYVARASLMAMNLLHPADSNLTTSDGGVAQSSATLEAKDQGGRPPEYDWDAMKVFTAEIIAKYGKPGRGNQKLPVQEDLVKLILQEWGTRDIHPSPSNVRKRVSKWLKQF